MKYTLLLFTLIIPFFTATSPEIESSLSISIEESSDNLSSPTNTTSPAEKENPTPYNTADSSVIDNLDFLDNEITPQEFMYYLSELINSIINNQKVISKEALQAYIAQQIIRIVSTHNIHINVSISRKKTTTPQGPPNQKALDIVNNIAGLVSNVCCAIKEQRAQNTPELTNHLEGICSNIINIAMIATH